jgi:hypothetical protein
MSQLVDEVLQQLGLLPMPPQEVPALGTYELHGESLVPKEPTPQEITSQSNNQHDTIA